MIEFVCIRLPVRIAQQGCHGNHAILQGPNVFVFSETMFSHPLGPKKQFGTNTILSLGCKVCQIRFCGIGYPISVLI